MDVPQPDAETRQALEELQRYLSDQVPPLMVRDSVEMLLDRPAQLVALQIRAWGAAQSRGVGSSVPISSYLFHALKKIQLMGEYKLLPKAPLDAYLTHLCGIVVDQLCPEEERDILRESLTLIGQSESIAGSIEMLHLAGGGLVRPSGTVPSAGAAAPPGLTEGAARGLRRFSLLLDRMAPMLGGSVMTAAAAEAQQELMTQILTSAAVSSGTSGDFEEYLSRMRGYGLEARSDQVFRALARGLPNWSLVGSLEPAAMAGADGSPGHGERGASSAQPHSDGPLEAMHKIISFSNDPEEGAKRFSEMVHAAVERFNEGSLGAAVAMIDLAERIIVERKLRPDIVRSILHSALGALQQERLGELAEKPDRHPQVRKIIGFFPELQPRGMLDELVGEARKDRRRRHLLLALLEVHGAPAREAAFEDLKASLEGRRPDIDAYHQRNLLYLLRRIPAPAGDLSEEELDYAVRLSGRTIPSIIRKEAIALLGQAKNPKAEQALVSRVRELEETLTRTPPPADANDLLGLLDRTVFALARRDTPGACRAVVEHGLKVHPQLGETFARLKDLAGTDLSSHPQSVERLLAALKAELPVKVLGFRVQKTHANAEHLVKALSGTPAPGVRHLFEDIVKRFPGEEWAAVAARSLSSFGATVKTADAPATTLSGDLEIFGLPNLLQSLSDSEVSGTLSLTDAEGGGVGTLVLEAGKLRAANVGSLHGEDAVYQLFERPVAGSFSLKSHKPDAAGTHPSEAAGAHGGTSFAPSDAPPSPRAGASSAASVSSAPPSPLVEIVPLVFEAMRRHDELRRARALVPDGIVLKHTASKPTEGPFEKDTRILRAVWTKINSGATPEQCEAAVAVDAYRVRTLLAHWLEEGSLQRA